MITNRTLLLVDFSSLLHKAAHVNKLLSHNNKPTGALYGFLMQLANLVVQVKPRVTVVCLDTKPYARSLVYPQYKESRSKEPMDEWLGASIAIGKKAGAEFMDIAGIRYLGIPGLEADDIAALLALNHQHEFEEVAIGANDSDLYSLLNDKVYMMKGGGPRGTRKPYTIATFKRDYQDLDPSQWPLVQAITGGHNGLKGIDGVGEKTAIQYITDTAACLKSKRGQKILDNWDLVEFNLPLAALPPPVHFIAGTDKLRIPELPKRGVLTRKVGVFLNKFGIELNPMLEAAIGIMRSH